MRRAAREGDISNTTWGRYENGTSELTATIQAAIAAAFGWPDDWPRDPPVTAPVPGNDRTAAAMIAELERRLDALERRLDEEPPPTAP